MLDPKRQPHSLASPPPAEALLAAIVDSSGDAIISKTLDGTITSWNRGAERIFGYTVDEAVGESIQMLLPPDRLGEETKILERVRRGERIEHYETIRRRKDGTLIPVSVTISPIRNAVGEIIGASKVARDVGDRQQADRAGRLLAAIVTSSDDAIISKNLDGFITSWNEGAERMFGYMAAEAIGRSIMMLIPAERQDEERVIIERLRRGERVDHFQTIRLRKDGRRIDVSLTISPVKDREGNIVGASKVARDVSELKRISDEREQLLDSERAARTQAERANRMKDEFLAIVSHELRTPLNAIVGWAEVLRSRRELPDDVAKALEVIDRNAKIQVQLIDDLLDLGRVAAGKMTLDIGWVDVTSVVRQAIGSVAHAAHVKQITIKAVLKDDHAGMMGDAQRLQQVVWNLLSNAIKFTPKQGSVRVSVARINSHIDVVVSDNGIGIAAEFLPHVFERFRQADSSTTRQHGGLGIGLSLVKHLVELHAGTVRVESPGAGQGTTFTVTLPVAVARLEAPDSDTSGPQAAVTPDNLTGIKVLAVDDEEDSLDLIRRVLEERGAEVQTAGSVEEAVTCFTAFCPDVVISDIGMPGHDGYELIRRLRALENGAATPAAALTALARSEDRMRALRAGYQTHIAKPVAAAEIVAVVQSLASLHRSPRG